MIFCLHYNIYIYVLFYGFFQLIRRVNQRNKENIHEQRQRESRGRSQSQLALDSNGDISGDLFYNSRPPESRRQASTVCIYFILK